MTEQERIRALLDEGKISQEEADMLLKALDEIDAEIEGIDAEIDGGEASANRSNAGQEQPTPPAPPEPPRRERKASEEQRGLHWVRARLLAGNLTVSVDADLHAPVVTGNSSGEAELVRSGEDWQVSLRGPSRQRGISSLWTSGAEATFDLRVPAGYGLDLDGKAGNVKITGVPYLKGSMKAGNLDAHEVGGLELDMKAGTLDVSMKPEQGRHHLDMKAGTARVKLLPGSSARLEGDVKAGSVSLPKGFQRVDQIAGASFSGVVGEGAAHFQLSQKAGTLDIRLAEGTEHE